MKPQLGWTVAALQLALLGFMAGQREWITHTGSPLTLRTAPIDPTDPMRGAYMRLGYELSFVPTGLCRGATTAWFKDNDYSQWYGLRDRVVYAALKVNEFGLAELVSLDTALPLSGPFLRGRVQSVDAHGVWVRYGIEALFMGQEAAQRMEDAARKEKAGAPMDVNIVVGPSGIAVLKDSMWEPLGITIALDPTLRVDPGNSTAGRAPRRLRGLTVTLHNYGDHNLAIVDLPDDRSFRLVPDPRLAAGRYDWIEKGPIPVPAAADVIVLKPGESRSHHLDLTQTRWWITDRESPTTEPMPIQELKDAWMASFRVEYAPPKVEVLRSLPNATLVRAVPIRSRAFNANQGID